MDLVSPQLNTPGRPSRIRVSPACINGSPGRIAPSPTAEAVMAESSRMSSARCGPEAAIGLAPRDDLARTAARTAAGFRLLVNGEDHWAIFVLGARVLVATDAEGTAQPTGGHIDLLARSLFATAPGGISVPTFFNLGARFNRMTHILLDITGNSPC